MGGEISSQTVSQGEEPRLQWRGASGERAGVTVTACCCSVAHGDHFLSLSLFSLAVSLLRK